MTFGATMGICFYVPKLHALNVRGVVDAHVYVYMYVYWFPLNINTFLISNL